MTLYQVAHVNFQDIHLNLWCLTHLIFYYSYDISRFRMSKTLCFLLLFGCLVCSTALADNPHRSDHVNANLITEVRSIQPGQSFSVGVLLVLEKGWHTYWRNPGDSGLPVTVSWKLPTGFIPGEIQWPYPSRLGTDSVVNFGYEEEVLLITDIKASPAVKLGETIKIDAEIEWLVCKEECLPGQAVLSLRLPVENKEPELNPIWKEKFEASRKKLPVISQDWPVRAAIDKNHIIFRIASPSWFKDEMKSIQFFPEQLEIFDYSAPQFFEKTDNGYSIQAKLSALTRKIPSKLKVVLVSDKSWSRVLENKAMRIVVPLAQHNKKNKTPKEVS